jgi:hypothetical protein
MKAWTDYPFEELGDIAHQQAPVRPVEVLSYDGNKYCRIVVDGVESEVKLGYLYKKPGRCGEVPKLGPWKLRYSDGTPYWQRNKRREQKTTWTVELWTKATGLAFRHEVDTQREAASLFNASPVGTVVTRKVDRNSRNSTQESWEHPGDIAPFFGGRVKKQRRGRK